ncbi:hypothetical protein BDDG_09576 [Blastomyces dermatitidis ATCC 18188]|uniref:Secreted protein n=1 Tax=Ajellomyces dermatitidis (strain ATCC 18188 / CBS 674.68) TaxID=653446 RepID=F2TTR6_AJEDA|nr:hypothetical protein BDDG_09576 [Blastomyces dermatitidis ATCC 18188]EQL28887.1 hypothetical protein BDFG_08408 [Blastomyces dermatitidis ATCC 26199]
MASFHNTAANCSFILSAFFSLSSLPSMMTGYPSSHQHALSRPVKLSVNTYQWSEPVQHTPSLDDCEAAEKRQSVWSAFWLEEGPKAHVSPHCSFAKRFLQQLSALKQKFLSCVQSMWAAINSAC